MQGLRFDPSKAVMFDLENGLVHLEGAPSRVLTPAAALGALCNAAGAEATTAFGREMGMAMGRRLAERLSVAAGPRPSSSPVAATSAGPSAGSAATRSVRATSLESLVEHLGGELALAGLGTLAVERWGQALVMVLDQCPLDARADRLLEAVFEGALEAAAGRTARALRLDRDPSPARFLIANGNAVAQVRSWLASGMSWEEALAKLHGATRGKA
ncbi:hypothetical protein [Chondromyces crocatus]|uniref:Uncharacterized protein n=1 Tax=Chondromyces crocatus TaxID=52 RepID=A0A0K1E6L1_CHOCO|nr:hypothetical protein [Chondromyces crocatus]AKT36322.1 uncharacterized protein CMC5_004360 [Chondromyces crocatus]